MIGRSSPTAIVETAEANGSCCVLGLATLKSQSVARHLSRRGGQVGLAEGWMETRI